MNLSMCVSSKCFVNQRFLMILINNHILKWIMFRCCWSQFQMIFYQSNTSDYEGCDGASKPIQRYPTANFKKSTRTEILTVPIGDETPQLLITKGKLSYCSNSTVFRNSQTRHPFFFGQE